MTIGQDVARCCCVSCCCANITYLLTPTLYYRYKNSTTNLTGSLSGTATPPALFIPTTGSTIPCGGWYGYTTFSCGPYSNPGLTGRIDFFLYCTSSTNTTASGFTLLTTFSVVGCSAGAIQSNGSALPGSDCTITGSTGLTGIRFSIAPYWAFLNCQVCWAARGQNTTDKFFARFATLATPDDF